ncbi:hypothetical protein [Kutzneria chonburiensis]|uniref:Uncharacterized protein n=1 Tax=Kutzneria chonburiensis TaxID=1483604 RepID=A0ABV6MSX0_9PSEU|nr:hypothetical protein [Kutzneria chonburiensis]
MKGGNYGAGVHFLLSLIEPKDAAAVRERLGIQLPKQYADSTAAQDLLRLDAPKVVWFWMLERDDPATNLLVFHQHTIPDVLKRDILRGRAFGPAREPLTVPTTCPGRSCTHREPEIFAGPRGVIGELRHARTLGLAREAVQAVGVRDWDNVAGADRVQPLSGYTRWALAERIDCPPEVRAQFGSHAKFTNRLRDAGIVELREYVEQSRPPQRMLEVLQAGAQLFPQRAGEAAALLAPLVRAEIGADPDAWAVLAQLLPTFAGTLPELLRTCGAIASR